MIRFGNSSLSLLALAAVATGCSQPDPGIVQREPGNPVIVLSEGACFGTCPIYDMTLRPNGTFSLYGERFVKETGPQEGSIGVDAWTEATAALEAADFWSVGAVQTPETLSNCQTDAPTARVTWRTEDGREKTLIYDAGCGVRKTQSMIIALRAALHFDDLVWTDREFPFDPGPPR